LLLIRTNSVLHWSSSILVGLSGIIMHCLSNWEKKKLELLLIRTAPVMKGLYQRCLVCTNAIWTQREVLGSFKSFCELSYKRHPGADWHASVVQY
jgi:hypothetical protein